MTVKELIIELSKYPENTKVFTEEYINYQTTNRTEVDKIEIVPGIDTDHNIIIIS